MPPDLALRLTLISSNNPCFELIFMVPKVFEPLKFYYSLFSYFKALMYKVSNLYNDICIFCGHQPYKFVLMGQFSKFIQVLATCENRFSRSLEYLGKFIKKGISFSISCGLQFLQILFSDLIFLYHPLSMSRSCALTRNRVKHIWMGE